MMVIMVTQVEVMVALQTLHIELVQIAPHLQNLKEGVDKTDIH